MKNVIFCVVPWTEVVQTITWQNNCAGLQNLAVWALALNKSSFSEYFLKNVLIGHDSVVLGFILNSLQHDY